MQINALKYDCEETLSSLMTLLLPPNNNLQDILLHDNSSGDHILGYEKVVNLLKPATYSLMYAVLICSINGRIESGCSIKGWSAPDLFLLCLPF